MGRLVISNNKDKIEESRSLSETAGFNDYNKLKNDQFYIDIYKKRKIEHENFIEYSNGDYIFGTGTYIAEGNIGAPALEAIYKNFNGDIDEVRKGIVGHFALGIKKGSSTFIFCDKYSLYDLFYTKNENEFILSNSFYIQTELLEDKEVIENKFLEEVFQIGIMGKETFYKGVYKLLGHEYIELVEGKGASVHKGTYERERFDLKNKSLKECVDLYAQKVTKVFSEIEKAFGNREAVLEMTGGFDSRSVFSALNHVGMKVNLAYGVGNSIITNTKEGDLEITRQFAEKYDRHLHLMNWRHEYGVKQDEYREALEKYGLHFRLYACNTNYFQEYEHREPKYPHLFLNGDFGENLKAREWISENPSFEIPLEKVIKKYHLPLVINKASFVKGEAKLKDYTEYLENELEAMLAEYRLPVEHNSTNKDQFDELRQIFARSMDNKILNFRNELSYSLAPYGLEQLYEFMFDVPYEYRKDSLFQASLIEALDKTVMEMPFFSHTKPKSLAPENTMARTKKLVKGYLRNNLKFLYKYYYRFKHQSKESSQLENEYRSYLKENSFLNDVMVIDSITTERLLARMVLYSYFINQVGYSKIKK